MSPGKLLHPFGRPPPCEGSATTFEGASVAGRDRPKSNGTRPHLQRGARYYTAARSPHAASRKRGGGAVGEEFVAGAAT
ncbi:hypothetical protein Asera_39280 [Actinocatenispora sera]|uniref:Uncharacterized protein n=1 Tax=Actinocatenispora sera TaxID=390989 RepID=A0A810L2Q5_9ACTN|nr:hypothetical protein Asera_39280 [Actinocatenispora sera]